MFHRASSIEYLPGTAFRVTFRDGLVKEYDVSVLFDKYPVMLALQDRSLFEAGKLTGYGIIWNDDIDLETETVYEEGNTVGKVPIPVGTLFADELLKARASAGITQAELSRLTGIDQGDISKIENGVANPSLLTMERLAKGLNFSLVIGLHPCEKTVS